MGKGYTSLPPLRLHRMLPLTYKYYVTTTMGTDSYLESIGTDSRETCQSLECVFGKTLVQCFRPQLITHRPLSESSDDTQFHSAKDSNRKIHRNVGK
jgi:hypothetical protein